MKDALIINPNDNVAVALRALKAGETVDGILVASNIDKGHKIAISPIKKGDFVLKYGAPIGIATADIAVGEWVHSHNLKSGLNKKEYSYNKIATAVAPVDDNVQFDGYVRKDGRVGTRNVFYIVSTVGCINGAVIRLADYARRVKPAQIDCVIPVTHQFGCSQLGDDQLNTQRLLSGVIHNPNAAAVLVVGLGCENNNIAFFKTILGEYDCERVAFLNAQDFEDELSEGKRLIDNLVKVAAKDARTKVNLSRLTVGLKCGGSDGFSGITANPVIGRICDKLTARGAKVIMTEVPEMFGAEERLFERSKDIGVYNKSVELINNFKDYFTSHNMPIYENPSPGNKAGGITTLEEKSLGCTQKSGASEVVGVSEYACAVTQNGLSLLCAPGNDIVATSALAAAGATLVLFSTGRGTPLGGVVPVVKIASNTALAQKKKNWIDFDAGEVLERGVDAVADALFAKLVAFASGEETASERSGNYDFAVFKNGITL